MKHDISKFAHIYTGKVTITQSYSITEGDSNITKSPDITALPSTNALPNITTLQKWCCNIVLPNITAR